jgi:CSLREA domain-containing protein
MRTVAVMVIVLLGIAVMPAAVSAGQIVAYNVTKTADTNDGHCNSDCSLREAISAANASPVVADVNIPAGTYKLTRKGRNEQLNATGDLDIRAGMRINGAGARNTIINGNGIDRVFDIPSRDAPVEFAVFINDLSITGGRVKTGAGGGLSVFDDQATLHLVGTAIRGNYASFGGGLVLWHDTIGYVDLSTISGNHATAGNGGGIDNAGQLSITNSTISGNHATAGGGIEAEGGAATLSYATVAFNVASNSAGGIDAIVGSATVNGTIVAKNTVGTAVNNCSVPIGSGGHNLENGTSCGLEESTDMVGNPKLSTLGNHGGPTNTHKLLKGSLAINHGGTSGFPATDQRGVHRPRGTQADTGAFER